MRAWRWVVRARMETPFIWLWFAVQGSEVGAGNNEGAEQRGEERGAEGQAPPGGDSFPS